MAKKYYLTEYKAGDGTYGNYVIATSLPQAIKLLAKRRMKEKIISLGGTIIKHERVNTTEKLFRQKKLVECAHTLAFVGNALCNAKIMKHQELLVDNGLLHEVIHLTQFGLKPDYSFDRKGFIQRLRQFDLKAAKLGF